MVLCFVPTFPAAENVGKTDCHLDKPGNNGHNSIHTWLDLGLGLDYPFLNSPFGSCQELEQKPLRNPSEREHDPVDAVAGHNSELEEQTRERSIPFDLELGDGGLWQHPGTCACWCRNCQKQS